MRGYLGTLGGPSTSSDRLLHWIWTSNSYVLVVNVIQSYEVKLESTGIKIC